MKENLITNYLNWIATTKNPEHKIYAQTMLAAVYDGNHAKMFKQYGDKLNAAYKYKR